MAAKFILSEKGKRKFCDEENYVYEKHQDNKKKSNTYWRCENRYLGCPARIHSISDTTEVCGKFGEHSHPSSKSAVEARIAVGKMKQHIANAMSTREIIDFLRNVTHNLH